MKRDYPDQMILTVNIPEDIYRRVLNLIKTQGLPEAGVIQRVISAGLLKLKFDMIKEENTAVSSQIENLRKEAKRLIEEIGNIEKICIQSRRDNDYISKRLEKFNAENEELEAFIRPTTLRGSRRKLDDNV
jgi:hypothetical protein